MNSKALYTLLDTDSLCHSESRQIIVKKHLGKKTLIVAGHFSFMNYFFPHLKIFRSAYT